ncbi:MAG: metal ABC transporter ATP-binding protein [Thermodesulfovibrionales bacterium]|nr:metal ABC transporter ATP-binding protein [Thermodesulfovibrionales bacterium]
MGPRVCIEVKGVGFGYQGGQALSDVSFSVHEGEYLGIIGPNGGGKTTLLKIVLGLLSPDEGSVRLFGEPSEEFSQRYRIGYVPQGHGAEPFPASVSEVVWSGRFPRMGLLARRSPEDREAVGRAMEAAGVHEISRRLLGQLSGGERQRVSIARALASGPEVLILDEPSVGVDIGAQEAFYAFLGKLNRDQGMTILFVSHDVGVVAREVGTLLCLNKRMVCHGRPENIIKGDFLETVYGSHVKNVYHRHGNLKNAGHDAGHDAGGCDAP